MMFKNREKLYIFFILKLKNKVLTNIKDDKYYLF